MDTVDDVIRIQESAEILQKVIKTKLGDGLQDMAAVQERLETYNLHGNRFSERIFKFLKEQFDYQAKAYRPRGKGAQPHEQIEDALIKYQGFNLWEKEMEPRMYNELQRVSQVEKMKGGERRKLMISEQSSVMLKQWHHYMNVIQEK